MIIPRFSNLKLVLATAVILAGTPFLCAAEDIIKIDKAVLGDSLVGNEWKDVRRQKRNLANKILDLLPEKKLSDKDVNAFLKNPANRLLLARWYFVDSFGNAVGNAAKSKEKKILFQVLSSEEWLNGFVYSGRLDNAHAFLPLFMKIAAIDSGMPKDPVTRKIATTTAGEFSRQKYYEDSSRVLRRYRFFAKSYRENTLNSLFSELDFWDMRIVCGWISHNGPGWDNEISLRWSRDNVKLPEWGYAGQAIHQLHYRLFSKGGDTVHGADYYKAYEPIFTGKNGVNQAAMAYEVGAVCGGVSHFGATGAIANGVPAITMGEPGHCAFATRNNNVWRDNNSINWRRSTHWTQTGEREWAFMTAMQDAFGDQKTCLAAMQRIALAKLFSKTGNERGTKILAIQAIETQPNNYLVWQEAVEILNKEKEQSLAVWQKLHDLAIEGFASKYSNVAARCLQKLIYPQLLPLVENDKKKVETLVSIWKKTETHGPASWDMESFWDAQKALAGNAGTQFVAATKSALKGKKDYEQLFNNWAAGNPRKEES